MWVDVDGMAGGRRIAVHEFPGAELPYNEDLGQQARTFDVDAYVVGEHADRESVAFQQACLAPGTATLVLPLFGSIRARCLDIVSDRSKDKHGFVAFRVRFIADGLSLSSLGGAPHLRSQIRHKVRGLPAFLARATRSRLATVGDRNVPGSVSRLARLPDFVLGSAIVTAEAWLGEVEGGIANLELSGPRASTVARTIADLYDDIGGLVVVGAQVSRYGTTTFVADDTEHGASDLVDRTFGLLDALREATDSETAVPVLKALSEFGDGLDAIPQTTLNRRVEAGNRETLVALFRRSALAQLALAVVNATYTSRPEAVAARADLAERFEAELNAMNRAEQWEVLQEMRDLLGLAVDYLSKVMADLAPVIVVEVPARMPSLYWAYRLYGDATRGDELAARNRIKHPMWMPREFEALAR